MKRFLATFLLFCSISCMLPVPAFATSNSYMLEDLGMSIELSPEHVVFTRDVKSNDPNLSIYGLTKDKLYSFMLEQNIYLNAWDEDISYEIIVTMVESPFEDYNLFSDTTLNGFASALETEYAGIGITLMRSEIYQHRQAKFIKIYLSQPNNGETAYGLQYNTVYNGKTINITLQSYSGKIDQDKEAIIQNIVDTVCFDTDPQCGTPPAQTKTFTYIDKDSGMTFTVPANWVERPMSEERRYIDAKFTSNLEEGLCIIFSSYDIYELEELSKTEQLFLNRDAIGNDIFTKSDIAEMYGCKEEDVSMVTYGGKEYYSAEVTVSGSAYGITVSSPIVYLLRCENGYIYSFQFGEAKSSPYFADFENLLNSVKYPALEGDEAEKTQVHGSDILLIITVLIAFGCLIFWFFRSAIKKENIRNKPQEAATIDDEYMARTEPKASKAEEEETFTPDFLRKEEKADLRTAQQLETTVYYCHRCGNKLMRDSVFCSKCGTKIPTNEDR